MDNLRKCNFHKKGIILCYSFAFADSTLGQTSWANRLPSWANWLTQLEQRYQQSPHVRSSQFISSCPKKFINSLHLLPNIQGWHGLIFHSFIHSSSILAWRYSVLTLSFLSLIHFIGFFFFPNLIDRHFLARFGKSPTSSSYTNTPISISFIHSLHSQSDDEVVDPMPAIREECKVTTCNSGKTNYEACVKRITENKFGDCEAWYFDWLKCADKCIAPKIFAMTKE